MIRKITTATGILGVFYGLIPLAIYGIGNMGSFGILLIGCGLICLPRLWKKIARFPFLKRLVVLFIALGLSYGAFVSVLMLRCAYFNKPPETGFCAVIVLGSKVNGMEPSLMLKNRLDVAYDYLKENPEAVCIVTGGQGADEAYPEAYVMKRYLMNRGVSPDRVTMEDQSVNTRENIGFAAAMLPDKTSPAVIVTDSFHQLRANIFAKAESIDAYGLSSATPWGLFPSYWLRDMLGVAVAWLQTR